MDVKTLMNTPCGYSYVNEKGKTITEHPAVDCSTNCKHCGWNPEEAKRRMETGRFVYDENGIRSLHFSTP